MAFRMVLLIIMLVFCWCIFSCTAEEPENLSLFDPETFALPDLDFTEQDVLTSFNLSSVGQVRTISGTGSVSDQIRVNGTTGDYSESYLEIEGTDETSWRYSIDSGNYSAYSYTVIELMVTDATDLGLLSRGIATDGDVAESYIFGDGNVSGLFIIESLIPGSSPVQIVNGPYSQQIADSFTGDEIYMEDWGYQDGSGEEVCRIDNTDLIGYLSERDLSGKNITTRDTVSDDPSTFSVSYMDAYSVTSLANRYGQAYTEPDQVSSTQYVDDIDTGSLDLYLDSSNDESFAFHLISGEDINGPAYYGRAIATGDRAYTQAEYDLSSDFGIVRYIFSPFMSENPGVDEFMRLISGSDTGTGDTIHLSGDETLSAGDQSLSVEGRYDLSAPKIERSVGIEGGISQATQSLLTGGENGLPVSLKGYIKHQASSVQPMASLQSLFYADAKRGTPVQWESNAYRGDENVTATGSTTSGSGFIRQKAYADRSTLTAE